MNIHRPQPGQAPVALNARFLCQPFSGVQRYSYELARLMPEIGLITPGPALPPYAALDDGRIVVRRSKLGGHAWEQFALPRVVSNGALLWSPGGSGPLAERDQVLTIHDVAHLEHPEWYSRKFALWYRLLLPLLAHRVRRILTVSHFSKRRIMEALRVPPERIVVTSAGVDSRFRLRRQADVDECRQRFGLDAPYLLAVAAVTPRKNFDRLYAAWTGVMGALEGVQLVIVGKLGVTYGRGVKPGALPPRTRLLDFVSDEDLVCLYNGALAFVYPSLYEGFGSPIVEAMACGAPLITSNRTAMPETAGDAAVLVDPYDVGAIGRAMLRLVGDPALRERLRQRGLARAAQLTYEGVAARTRPVLEEEAARLARRTASQRQGGLGGGAPVRRGLGNRTGSPTSNKRVL